MSEITETLSAIAYGEGPVLETLADMNLDTLERSGLDERTYIMVRIAALMAMDASPTSYYLNVAAAVDVIDQADLQGILVALAPVVGSARIASAASNVLDVFIAEADGYDLEEATEADGYLGVLVEEPAPGRCEVRAEEEGPADEGRRLETV
jgi:4-carboxymuconolactone decarboxylase